MFSLISCPTRLCGAAGSLAPRVAYFPGKGSHPSAPTSSTERAFCKHGISSFPREPRRTVGPPGPDSVPCTGVELRHYPCPLLSRTPFNLDYLLRKLPASQAHVTSSWLLRTFPSVEATCLQKRSPALTAHTWQEGERNEVHVHLPCFKTHQDITNRAVASSPFPALQELCCSRPPLSWTWGSSTCIWACVHLWA